MAMTFFERCLVFFLRSVSRLLLVLLSLPARLSSMLEWITGRTTQTSGAAASCSWSVSPPTEPLLLLPGVELARRIRQRKVKCTDVVQAYVKRIQEVNPMINALVKDRYKEALQEARQVDEMLMMGEEDEESLREKFPLLGVPITVKEAFELHGMPNSSGLMARRNVISNTDAIVVARLKQAGAIPLGVTNCSELCMWYESSNNVYGRSNNPYDVRRIVGGSSGGEGCILGAAGSVIGIGSDIGGSIRMPAFFNGIFGHKPTQGVVPNEGQFPNASRSQKDLLSTGPMCRYAEDLEPMLRIMAGNAVSKLKLDKEVSLLDIKFYSMEHDGGSLFVYPVDQELIQAQRRVVEHLESQLGVSVQHVEIQKMKYSFQIWSALMSKGTGGQKEPSFTDLLGDHGKAVWPVWELMKWMVGLSSHTIPAIGLALAEKLVKLNPSRNAKLESMAKNLRTEMVNFLGEDGVLFYPSHPKIAPRHHLPLGMPFNFAYTGIFNILGLPVTQCPLGLSSEGLPLGIQLVSSHFNDHLTLSVAKYLEKAFGGWTLPGRS